MIDFEPSLSSIIPSDGTGHKCAILSSFIYFCVFVHVNLCIYACVMLRMRGRVIVGVYEAEWSYSGRLRDVSSIYALRLWGQASRRERERETKDRQF